MNSRWIGPWSAGLLVLCAVSAHAGVTVYGDAPPVITLITGTVVDDSDPLGSWPPMGPVTPGQLQGSGGPPSVAFKHDEAWPLVVWSSTEGLFTEIAFSEWTQAGWSGTELLTDNLIEDLDPRVFIETDHTVYVAWWEPGDPERVLLMRRRPGFTSWDPKIQVSQVTESARRPSVQVYQGQLRVAYERDSTVPGMAQDVVVAVRNPGGTFDAQVVASTPRTERLDVVLHAAGGKLWVDWKHDAADFGRSEFVSGAWTVQATESWTDPTWVGEEGVRKLIQQAVVGQ